MEELAANAEEQHLDADVKVRAPTKLGGQKTSQEMREPPAPKQMQQEETSMNSLASSKREVFRED